MIPHDMTSQYGLALPAALPADAATADTAEGRHAVHPPPAAADPDPIGVASPAPSATVITVVSGCGGAGGSTLAAMLTIAAAQARHRAALLDADPMGPGSVHTLATVVLRAAADMADGEVTVRSCTGADEVRTPCEELRAALAHLRPQHDLIVVDCPRYWGVAITEVLDIADMTLVVVPARADAVIAAGRVTGWLTDYASRVECVVRDPGDGDLSSHRIADTLRLHLAGEITPPAGANPGRSPSVPPRPRDADLALLHVARGLVGRELSNPTRGH